MKKNLNNLIKSFNNLIEKAVDLAPLYSKKYNQFIKNSPYARLMRLDNMTGALLVFLPISWTILIASSNIIQIISLFLVFGLGSITMRGAGVVINDIIDNKIDKKVERTKKRPIANFELSISQGIKLLSILLLSGCLILIFLPKLSVLLSIITILMVIIYPFTKRYTNYPQFFLGFTINMGILISWFAIKDKISASVIFLYLASIVWTIAYDTIYAYQDIVDDKKIGVKSTAVLLGNKGKEFIKGFYKTFILLIALAGLNSNINIIFYIVLLFAIKYITSELENLNLESSESCKIHFKKNSLYGTLILLAFLIGKI